MKNFIVFFFSNNNSLNIISLNIINDKILNVMHIEMHIIIQCIKINNDTIYL